MTYPSESSWQVTAKINWEKGIIYDEVLLKNNSKVKIKQITLVPHYAKTDMPKGYSPPGNGKSIRTFDKPMVCPPGGMVFQGQYNHPWSEIKESLTKDQAEKFLNFSSFEIKWIEEGKEEQTTIIGFPGSEVYR